MLDIFSQAESPSTYPFIEGRHDWPAGAIYRYDRTGHEIIRVVHGVDDEMAAAVAYEPIDLALIISEPLVVICSKVGDVLPWAGASFHWHRVRRSDQILPNPGQDNATDSRIELMLLESPTGRVRAVRSLILPADFTRRLHDAILDQARFNYDPGEERRAMESLVRRCPTPGSLVAYASAKAHLVA